MFYSHINKPKINGELNRHFHRNMFNVHALNWGDNGPVKALLIETQQGFTMRKITALAS